MKHIVITFMAALAAATATGATVQQPKFDLARFTTAMDALMDARYSDDTPGAAWLVAVDGNIIYDRGVGLADLDTREKIDGNTAFNIASISKQFTAMGLLALQERGLVDISDPVAKYFPHYRSPMWQRITLAHLLSHSSGVPDARPRHDRQWVLHATDAQSMEYFHDLDSLKFAPGTAYDYINPTFQLVAAVIAQVAGTSFEEYQQRRVFDRAGMTNVRYFFAGVPIPHMAHGYIVNDGTDSGENDNGTAKERPTAARDYVDRNGTHWAECDYGEETFFATRADGGIYTSTHDLLQWEMALRHNLVAGEAMKRLAYTPRTTVSGSPWCTYQNRPHTAYGLGFFIDDTPGRTRKVYHTGDNGGFQAYLANYDDGRVVVVMLENRNDHDRWATQQAVEDLLRPLLAR